MGSRLIAAMLAAATALVSGADLAEAHPHAWIDVRTTVVLDAEERIAAIEQEWLFDSLYSLYVAEGAAGQEDQSPEALTRLAGENLKNLAPHNYFLEVRADGKPLEIGTVTEYASEMRGSRLWMRFVAPLADPVDPRARQVVFRVYDPSYWIEMLHLEGDVVALRGKGAGHCSAPILATDPSPEDVAKAAALDRGASGGEGLGLMFAERVPITCD